MNVNKYFRFSLKDLCWLILLTACNLGWYVAKVKPVHEAEARADYLQSNLDASEADRHALKKLAGEMGNALEISEIRDERSEQLKVENTRLYNLLTYQQKAEYLDGNRELREQLLKERHEVRDPYDAGNGTYFLGPVNYPPSRFYDELPPLNLSPWSSKKTKQGKSDGKP